MKNADALFLKLRQSFYRTDDVIPPGYKDTAQLMSIWNVSKTHALRLINKAIADGTIERVNIMRDSRVIPYYGPPRKYKSTKPKR